MFKRFAISVSFAGSPGVMSHGFLSPSSVHRGTRWRWKWKTCCQPDFLFAWKMVNPSGSSRSLNNTATSCDNVQTARPSSGSRSQMSSAWAFGITNVWPSAAGLISRNATARSDSATLYEGASSAAIEQKMQLIITALLIQVLGDLHGIEGGARTEVVRAAEQDERIVAARDLPDPAHDRDIAACRVDRRWEDVVGRVVRDL